MLGRYQNAMAAECLRLGYDIRYTRDARERIKGFEIVGVDEAFSGVTLSAVLQTESASGHFISKHGREPSTSEIHAITTQTRDPSSRKSRARKSSSDNSTN